MSSYSSAKWKDAGARENIAPAMPRVPHPESREAIAQRLTLLRLAHSAALGLPEPLLQEEFASRIGGDMTPQKWTNYLKCRDLIPVDAAKRLCRLTGATLDYVYLGLDRGISNVLAAELAKITRRERATRRA